MVKFFALVKNEYIKLFKKVGTFAVLALVFASIIGAMFIFRSLNDPASINVEVDSYESIITDLKTTKPKYYEKSIELYRYLIKKNIDFKSWQSRAVSDLVDTRLADYDEFPQEEFDKLKGFIDNSDWKGYFKDCLENKNLDPASRWTFELFIRNDIEPTYDEFQTNILDEIERIVNSAASSSSVNTSDDPVALLNRTQKNSLAVYEYMLTNDIRINVSAFTMRELQPSMLNTWGIWMFSSVLIYAVTIAVVIFAGNIVAGEFSQGTIKFLLVNPVKRWKILLSKYVTVMSIGIALVMVVFLICGLFSALLFGTEGQRAACLTAENGVVTESSPIFFVIRQWLYYTLMMIMMLTLTFSLSSFSKRSSIAIGISIALLFIGSTLSELLKAYDIDWGRYLLFSNLDIWNIADNEPMFYGQTVGFAAFVIIEHIAVFIITAFDSFRKKEI